MPETRDRREFLSAFGAVVVSTVVEAAPELPIVNPPKAPPKKASLDLEVLSGDELIAVPTGATRRIGSAFMRTNGSIRGMRCSPKGSLVLAASSDELRWWDVSTGKLLLRTKYPAKADSSNGSLTERDTLVVLCRPEGKGEYEFRHYSAVDRRLVVRCPMEAREYGGNVHFARDGRSMYAVLQQRLVRTGTEDGKQAAAAELPPKSIGDVKTSPDGKLVAVSVGQSVLLFHTADLKGAGELKLPPRPEKKEVKKENAKKENPKKENPKKEDLENDDLPDPNGDGDDDGDGEGEGSRTLSHILWSPDGRSILVSAGHGDRPDHVVWDVEKKTVIRRITKVGVSMGFVSDGVHYVSRFHGTAVVVNMRTGERTRQFDICNNSEVHLTGDGRWIVCESGDAIMVYDTQTGSVAPHRPDPQGTADQLRVDHDGKLIGLLRERGGWTIIDPITGKSTSAGLAVVGGRTPLAMTPNRKFAAYRKDRTVEVWDLEKQVRRLSHPVISEDENCPHVSARLTPDGETLVVADEKSLRQVRVADGVATVLMKLTADTSRLSERAVGTSPDGELIAVVDGQLRDAESGYGNLEVLDRRRPEQVKRQVLTAIASQLRFSTDGKRLAMRLEWNDNSGRKYQVVVLSLATGKFLVEGNRDHNQPNGITFSPDGRYLLASLDKKSTIWETASGYALHTFEGTASIISAAFSQDGRTLYQSAYGAPIFEYDFYSIGMAADKDDRSRDRLWEHLGSSDGPAAYRAVRSLLLRRDDALKLLSDRIDPASSAGENRIRGLIADLDSPQFRTRQAAEQALAEFGEQAYGLLRAEAEATRSEEVRTRIGRLLKSEHRPSLDILRVLRAVEVLERIGGSAAEKVLTRWAGGSATATLTAEAKAALQRLRDPRSIPVG